MVKGEKVFNYAELKAKLDNSRNYNVKLANNTIAHYVGQSIAIKLHYTDIIIIDSENNYELHTGGWYSVTTKSRLCGFSPAYVTQKKGTWYINDTEFFEGITVNQCGMITEEITA